MFQHTQKGVKLMSVFQNVAIGATAVVATVIGFGVLAEWVKPDVKPSYSAPLSTTPIYNFVYEDQFRSSVNSYKMAASTRDRNNMCVYAVTAAQDALQAQMTNEYANWRKIVGKLRLEDGAKCPG